MEWMPDLASGLKRFVLWDFRRASWQYDVMVALILGFVFLTPRDFFRDQPKASQIVMLPSENGTSVYWIEPELVTSPSEGARIEQAANLLKKKTGRKHSVVRLEPIFDSEKEVKGYMAYTMP
ncbi:MAG: hypothetical protein JO022_09280 [Acidobacteriaceae bacterium]|nr:hypothetical protein [Acidobacteriaceae bacterium]